MAGKTRGYCPPEFKERAVLEVLKPRPNSQVAVEIGVDDGTLRKWVNSYRRARPARPLVAAEVGEGDLSAQERARLRALGRENRELRQKIEFLGKAAAFFAREYRWARA
jgi:transposase